MVVSTVLAAFHHQAFYSRMQAMGFDPLARERSVIVGMPLKRANVAAANRPLLYFFYGLEFHAEPAILAKLDDLYEARGWAAEMATGRSMVDLAVNANLADGEHLVAAFIRCVNGYFLGKASVQFRGWSPYPGSSRARDVRLEVVSTCARATCFDGFDVSPPERSASME